MNASTEVAVLPGAIVNELGSVPLESVVVAAAAIGGVTQRRNTAIKAAENRFTTVIDSKFG